MSCDRYIDKKSTTNTVSPSTRSLACQYDLPKLPNRGSLLKGAPSSPREAHGRAAGSEQERPDGSLVPGQQRETSRAKPGIHEDLLRQEPRGSPGTAPRISAASERCLEGSKRGSKSLATFGCTAPSGRSRSAAAAYRSRASACSLRGFKGRGRLGLPARSERRSANLNLFSPQFLTC